MDILLRIARAAAVLLFSVLLCGVLYPALVTGIAQVIPGALNDRTIEASPERIDRAVGHDWANTGLFEGRPPAVEREGTSTGSNLALTNPLFLEDVLQRAALWRGRVGDAEPVPVALVTASASGVDPDIPMRAALYQIPYVAKQTGLAPKRLDELVHAVMRREMIRFGFERLVNVTDLNRLVLAELQGRQNHPQGE